MGKSFIADEVVEIRYLPGDKTWERAIYVRKIRRDEMPALWKGPGQHVVFVKRLGRNVTITANRIRSWDPNR